MKVEELLKQNVQYLERINYIEDLKASGPITGALQEEADQLLCMALDNARQYQELIFQLSK